MTLGIKVQDYILQLNLEGALSDNQGSEFQKWADQVHQTLLDLQKATRSKVRILTDAGKIESIGDKIMAIYNDLLRKDYPLVYRSATYGSKPEIMATLSTLSITSGRPNFQHFKTKEEALNWLMQ